jgi:hypothetical protein
MKRTIAEGPPPAKRRRQEGDPQQTTHFEGKVLVVTLSAVVTVEFRHARAGRGLAATCGTCTAVFEGAGPALQKFYDDHYKQHAGERTSAEAPPPEVPPPAAGADAEARAQLGAALEQLAGDELDVVRLVVEGLVAGRPVYGQLDVENDPRDLDLEGLHEGRDQIVYDAGDLLRRIRRRRGGSA